EIAGNLGYAPSRVAGSLAGANSRLIAISVPTLGDAVFTDIVEGMQATLLSAGFDTMIETSDYDPAREHAWVERMIAWSPAAVVVSGVDRAEAVRERLSGSRIPTLELWDVAETPIDLCVGIDHHAAGLEMGRYLAGLGYRRPGYVGVSHGRDLRAEKRRAGLAAGFAEVGAGFVTDIRTDGTPSFETGMSGARAALVETTGAAPDVLCFLNDHLAFGGLVACEAAGLAVPERIGIVGFNALNINNVLPRRLTTSATPRKLMGATAARMLVAAIRGVRPRRAVTMPVELVPGATTRAR
ncbi:MAG: LacI family DNA-binding transcriptional regulator, partial [Pseudomonadota bacterium]